MKQSIIFIINLKDRSGLDDWFTVPVKYRSFSGQYHSNAPDKPECPINSGYGLKRENIRGNLNCIMPVHI